MEYIASIIAWIALLIWGPDLEAARCAAAVHVAAASLREQPKPQPQPKPLREEPAATTTRVIR